ncbi:LysR family glycine cleavage system transcriptional activator [Rhizobium subbaraonis]|uniref:LysR family glycine cleavage system transcriptional activator n=1 Tax=Rhizobium subbaraonis TaxID=908946 RepID=A0A285UJR2_9HYPH|nr:LysR substrate-binding domain-containing protein [Rhizobium subbaraonis]SOC42089.1 LysR family glycine cleavage system transcriptional activator [Rhizobium subbaraonis]
MKMARQFPLNAMRVFDAAARHASFTRAGEELGMTQTAVSYQIKLLEDLIGEPLFLRRPRQVVLTEVGQRLAPKVAEAFAILGDAFASVLEDAEGTLVISATYTIASKWLAPHLGSFHLQNPAVAVRLLTDQRLVDFSREAVDVAIRYGDGNWPGLACHRLMELTFTPMMSPKLADSVGGIEKPEDLLKLPIFDPTDPWWALWFAKAGVPDVDLGDRPHTYLGTQTLEADTVMGGHGIAMLNPEFYAQEVALGRLCQPFDIACTDGKAHWLVYPESRRNVPKIKLFRNWLRSELPTFVD